MSNTPEQRVVMNCTTCQFSQLTKRPPPELGEMLLCKFMPPGTVVIQKTLPPSIMNPQGGVELQPISMFPIVSEHVSCFQWRPRPAANSP